MVVPGVMDYPYKLLWLCKSPADEPCEKRKNLCKEILATPASQLHLNALKIRQLFREALVFASRTGMLCITLWAIMYIVACAWKGDTQAIEGINSIIKALCRRVRHLTLALVDARVGNRKFLSMGGAEDRQANLK